jgi:hypothetical protein
MRLLRKATDERVDTLQLTLTKMGDEHDRERRKLQEELNTLIMHFHSV